MVSLYVKDVREWCGEYNGDKFHAMMCDPPYHLGDAGFMAKDWDKGEIAFDPLTWSGLMEHLLPGAFAFVFAGAYNYHHVARAMQEAGFEIYPMIAWIHAQGMGLGRRIKDDRYLGFRYGKQALKPAIEPIVHAMKPCKKNESISATALSHGTGMINVEAGRIGDERRVNPRAHNRPGGIAYNLSVGGMPEEYPPTETIGRLPSNVVMTNEAAESILDDTATHLKSYYSLTDEWCVIVADKITSSPMAFYAPKANRKERDAGLGDFPVTNVGVLSGRANGDFDGSVPMGRNDHPTVKPLSLTRWLGSLLLPPPIGERRLLNPFSGSGSEAIGALNAGWDNVCMIEREGHYAELSAHRIKKLAESDVQFVS